MQPTIDHMSTGTAGNPLSERKSRGGGGLVNSFDHHRKQLKAIPMSTQHRRETARIGNIFEMKNETSMTLDPQLSDGSAGAHPYQESDGMSFRIMGTKKNCH